MSHPCALSNATLLNDLSSPCQSLLVANYTSVCEDIESSLSSPESVVYWPGSEEYSLATTHWSLASSEAAACSVMPASAEDVGEILRIVGSTSTPFAIKGGGHNTTPGSASTTGVHIAMQGFANITYNEDEQTADVGAGLDWWEVYEELEQYNVTVVGARSAGVGVGGLSLIGGFSWLTQEHGLTIDTIVGYQLVLPNGNVTEVTEHENPDLFFALKGGGNNFGIVTRFTFKVFPQGPLWGGALTFAGSELESFIEAMVAFNNQTDPKALVFPNLRMSPTGEGSIGTVLYYNAPTPPPGLFDKFLAIPTIQNSTVDEGRMLSSFLDDSSPPKRSGKRIFWENVPLVQYTAEIIRGTYAEIESTAQLLANSSLANLAVNMIPMLPDAIKQPPFRTAWPSNREHLFLWSYLQVQFDNASYDQVVRDELVALKGRLTELAIEEVQHPPLDGILANEYGGMAGPGTELEVIYQDNLAELEEIKSRVDPQNVMGLTGGFKLGGPRTGNGTETEREAPTEGDVGSEENGPTEGDESEGTENDEPEGNSNA